MSVSKNRRKREAEQLRRSILDAAMHLAKSGGWENVTVRNIAERIEYTPPAIYSYFKNKDAILLGLRQRGSEELTARIIAKYAQHRTKPRKALLRLTRIYVRYAFEHPEYYQLLFNLNGVNIPPANSGLSDSFSIFLEIFQQLGNEKENPTERAEAWSSMCHGFIATNLLKEEKGAIRRGAIGASITKCGKTGS